MKKFSQLGTLVGDRFKQKLNPQLWLDTKNLFKGAFEQGGLIGTAGNDYGKLSTSDKRIVSDYVPVKSNTTYTLKVHSNKFQFLYYFEYDSEKQSNYDTLPYVKLSSNTCTFTTSSITKYIRFSIINSIHSEMTPQDLNCGVTLIEIS